MFKSNRWNLISKIITQTTFRQHKEDLDILNTKPGRVKASFWRLLALKGVYVRYDNTPADYIRRASLGGRRVLRPAQH